jgi:hypothetical protein
MPCPRCGYDLTNVNAPACPNCGLPLAQQPSYPPAGYPGASSAPQYSQSPYQPGSEQQPTGWPPNYGATPGYPQNPANPGYGAPPSTPLGAPPSMPLGAPPSTPFGPGQGYPPTYYGQPGMPSQQFAPPPKKGNGLVIGIIVAILVVLVGGGAAAVAFSGGGTPTAATGTPTATSTLGPTATPKPTVLYQQSFASQPPSSDWSQDDNCFYSNGGYHIKNGYFCFAPAGTQADVTITVDVQQISGDTTLPYGIGFRRPSAGKHYEFDIDSTSEWVFYSCDPNTCNAVVDYTKNSAIKGGLNTKNTLSVTSKGSHFDFFVNGTKVGQADDSTYASGELGLLGSENVEIVFNNLLVTKP